MCLYADFLLWSVGNRKTGGFPQFFSFFGSVSVSLLTGISLGLLLTFAGVYVSACSLPGSVGQYYGIFWGIVSFGILYTRELFNWVYSS